MKAVIDTSTLISLAKIDCLELLRKLRKEVAIPGIVYHEAVIRGEEKSLPDAVVIRNFIKSTGMEILEVKISHINRLRTAIGKTLAQGDEAVLALALQVDIHEIIANDDGLGRIAMTMKLRVIASADILLAGYKNGFMNFDGYELGLRGLVSANRITPAIAELYIMEGKKYAKG